MTTTSKLAHLIFSTRGAEPASGSDFNREVIAWTPGIPDSVRNAFGLRADIAGSLLRQRQLPTIYTFCRLHEETWLFCRAVSLGLYRQGNHHLLVHGVLLDQEHLQWIDGNPFLLDDAEIGLAFADVHPGSRRDLEPLRLDPLKAGRARARNLERFTDLSQKLHHNEAFPNLFEGLAKARRTGILASGQPDPDWMEWLLLHLHPADRIEVSFHTWYTHSRAVDYQLISASESDGALLRQQFPEINLWPGHRESLPSTAFGCLVQNARQASLRDYLDTLHQCRITFLADVDERDPLAEADRRICLRPVSELTDKERAIRSHLSRRGGQALAYHLHELSRQWRDRGPAVYVARLETLGAEHQGRPAEEKIEPGPAMALLEALGADDWPYRWALTFLLKNEARNDDPDWREVLPVLIGELVPRQRFEQLLGFLASSQEAFAHAQAYLVTLDEKATSEPFYWPALLRWQAKNGMEMNQTVNRVECLIDESPDAIAIVWYRILQEVCFEVGLKGAAFRLLFQKEAPRLQSQEFQARIREGVDQLLDDRTSPANILRAPLGEPETAKAILIAMRQWLSHQEDSEQAWARWRTLFDQLVVRQGFLSSETFEVCGDFIACMAVSPLARHLNEALEFLVVGQQKASRDSSTAADLGEDFREAVLRDAIARLIPLARGDVDPQVTPDLPRGVASLVAECKERDLHVETEEILLKLLFEGLIHCEYAERLLEQGRLPQQGLPDYSRSMPVLRSRTEHYLQSLLDEGKLDRLMDSEAAWGDLLLDQLLRQPPSGESPDSLYRAGWRLAWRRWLVDQRSEQRIWRLLRWSETRRIMPQGWHHEQMRLIVPSAAVAAAVDVLERSGCSLTALPAGSISSRK
jgi:hypothetical protein